MYSQYTKIPLEGHNSPSSGKLFFDFVSDASRLNDKRPAQQISSLRATAHHQFITAFGNSLSPKSNSTSTVFPAGICTRLKARNALLGPSTSSFFFK